MLRGALKHTSVHLGHITLALDSSRLNCISLLSLVASGNGF